MRWTREARTTLVTALDRDAAAADNGAAVRDGVDPTEIGYLP
ncbi:hypothetical protein ACW14Y_42370 [Kitasatospora sp. cg17-2]